MEAKTKSGFKREGELFHFSPACADTIGEKQLGQFEKECIAALNILRENSTLLITLFMLMVGTGIPELRKQEDINFLKRKLRLNMTDDEIKADWQKLSKESRESTRTKINNLGHNWRVRNNKKSEKE